MAKDKITDYDSNASLNTDVGGVNLQESSMLPSEVNNAIREVMSHQKEAFGSGTPLFVDQTNNRVGIGGSSPTHPLQNEGTSYFKDNVFIAGGLSKMVSSDSSSNPLIFGINAVEKARITSAGNFGISNSSPSTAFQVGDGTLDKRSTFNPSNALAIALKNGSDHGGFIGSGGADIMVFSNSGGGEQLRISSGKVGIGTSSPDQNLMISDTNNIVDHNINDINKPAIGLQNTDTSNNTASYINFKSAYGHDVVRLSGIRPVNSTQTSSNTGAFAISTRNASSTLAERMRIFSNGRVGLADGTTPEDAAQLDVKRNSSDVVYFRNNSGVGVKLTAGNQSFSAVSDENKKENIVELDKQQSYDNIKNIRAVTYNFRDIVKTNEDGTTTTYEDDKSRIGFISQDWETNYSQLVNTDSEGIKSLLYTETTPVLLSALQKAQEKIEALEARITALEGE